MMQEISLQEYASPTAMLADFGEWLEENAAVNNMMLGLLYRLQRRAETGAEVDALMVGLKADGSPVMALLQTPPRELMVVSNPEGWEEALETAVVWLRDHRENLPGFIGSEPQVSRIAELYGQPWNRVFRQHVMKLEQLKWPQPCAGSLRLSAPGDVDTIRDWLVAFFQEALQKTLAVADATQLARAKIMEKQFWVWEVDGKVVSMAGVERPTRHGVTVVLVYTPAAERGKGYASNLTAFITDLQLRNGRKFTCLHTDADFPTSNKIYKALGYYEVGEGSILCIPAHAID